MKGNQILKKRRELGFSRKKFVEEFTFSEKTLQNLEAYGDREVPLKYSKEIEYQLNKPNELTHLVDSYISAEKNGTQYTFKREAAKDKKTLSKLAGEGSNEKNQEKVRNETELYLKRFISKLPKEAIKNIYSLYIYILNEKVPFHEKFVAFGALLYFISPVDAIPDITPIVGFLDDVGVIAIAVYTYMSSTSFKKIKKESDNELVKKGWINKL